MSIEVYIDGDVLAQSSRNKLRLVIDATSGSAKDLLAETFKDMSYDDQVSSVVSIFGEMGLEQQQETLQKLCAEHPDAFIEE